MGSDYYKKYGVNGIWASKLRRSTGAEVVKFGVNKILFTWKGGVNCYWSADHTKTYEIHRILIPDFNQEILS